QVRAAALLAGLDQAHAARARDALRIDRRDDGQGGVERIAVVGGAPAVQAAVLDARQPGPEALTPAFHLRLLVEVAVEEDAAAVVPSAGGRHLEKQARRQPVDGDDLDLQAGDRLGPRPGEAG